MITFLKKNLLWILLLGSLIGLNETLIGSMHMPFRSVVLSTISLLILSIGRYYFPKTGTSLLIILIAILFKVNNLGCHNACTSAELLCGPAAVLMLGISFELFATLFVTRYGSRLLSYALICILAAITTFTLFALMNVYLLKSWDVSRLTDYILLKGSLTAVVSSILTLFAIFFIRRLKIKNIAKFNPYVANGLAGLCTIIIWFLGTFYL